MNGGHFTVVLNVVLKDFAPECILQPFWYPEMSASYGSSRDSDQDGSERALRTVPRKLRPYENPK